MLTLLDFLGLYNEAATRKSYKRGLRRYLECIYQLSDDTRDDEEYNRLSVRYMTEQRDYRDDLRSYVTWLGRYAPKTAILYYTCTLVWLQENDREIPQRELKRIASRLLNRGILT